MKSLPYYVLDVFTNEPYKGNQLAVVCTEEELGIDSYYAIAREFGYSETSFVRYSTEESILKVRSFTPAKFEVLGAGHNLLGAVCLALLEGWAIFNNQASDPCVLIGDMQISLKITQEAGLPFVGMKQQPAQIKGTVPVERVAGAVGLGPTDIALDYGGINILQTEVPHLMVAVKSLRSLQGAVSHKAQLKALSEEFGFEGCYLFTVTDPEAKHLAETRFFNPGMGIDEDPATGTAAGPLAGYLQLLGRIEPNRDYLIMQGNYIDQPSLIQVKVVEDGIWVSGSSVITMKGTIYV